MQGRVLVLLSAFLVFHFLSSLGAVEEVSTVYTMLFLLPSHSTQLRHPRWVL